jgi:hypothetical protein
MDTDLGDAYEAPAAEELDTSQGPADDAAAWVATTST